MAIAEQLSAELDHLSKFDPSPFPVLSLYLDLSPNQVGRDQFEPFLRKKLADRIRTYPNGTPERESLERDAERIWESVSGIDPATNSLVLFACSGADLFVSIPTAARIEGHELHIADHPHLYPLARLLDQYRAYALLLANTNSARLFVVAVRQIQRVTQIEGVKTKRHKMGGWSQARYQRHNENYHLLHAKEIVDALARIVRDEAIESILIAGDEVIVPLIKAKLPKDLAERVVDTLKLDVRAGAHSVLESAAHVMHEHQAITAHERVEALLDAYRGNGLAVVGLDETERALDNGQVDELVLAAAPHALLDDTSEPSGTAQTPSAREGIADRLVAKARQTDAAIHFVDDAALAESIRGVGAFLRYRL